MHNSNYTHDARLDPPEFDVDQQHITWCEEILRISEQLMIAKQQGQYSAQFISWQELESFCRLNRLDLTPEECQILKTLDAVYQTTVIAGYHKSQENTL